MVRPGRRGRWHGGLRSRNDPTPTKPEEPATGEPPAAEELADHVAKLLAPHKRPRVVRYLDALPRNDMGKVMKRALGA